MPKQNQAATELWEQLFATMAKSEYATLVDPEHDDAADETRIRKGYAEAGWSEDEINFRIKLLKELEASPPVTSPGVAPHVEFLFNRLCDEVEAAMERLHLDSHGRTARGIEPRVGALATSTNVIMTDEGIITVGSFLFRFCGLIARAFTRTLQRAPYFWEGNDYSQDRARAYLRGDRELMSYWLRIFLSYCVTGTPILTPFRPTKQHELMLFEQIARAMEVFAIAHEYGHHHFGHGRQIENDAKAEEASADQFALKISYEVERKPLLFENPYLSSGAGGVILLLALDALKQTKELLFGTPSHQLDTHPEAEERIAKFDTVAVLRPVECGRLRSFRNVSARIMRAVQLEVCELINVLPQDFRQQLIELNRVSMPSPTP